MQVPCWFIRLALALALLTPVLAGAPPGTAIDQTFARLYNFDFTGAHAIIDKYIAGNSQDSLGYAVRSAIYVFSEFDRLGVLESEFLASDDRIVEKKKLKPDPKIRAQFLTNIDEAQSRALSTLKSKPDDQNALFTMCITQALVTDYSALIEKKQIGSLSPAKLSNVYAQRLLKVNPQFYDAYLTTGMTEYIVGSLPFFVRWFVRFDNVKGSKDQAFKNLTLVVQSGRYLKPFAKILLAILNLREKKPRESQKLLADLTRDYPDNQLIRKELAKLSAQLGAAN